MANFSGYVISDTAIIRTSVDKMRRAFSFGKYPWLSMLPTSDATGDQTHEWLNDVEGLVKWQINDSGGTTGGSTSEVITFDSTTGMVVNMSVVIGHDGTDAPQSCYISAVNSTTTATLITCDGDNLSSFADNTYVILGGDWVNYGETINHQLRLPTQASNTIEQIFVSANISENVIQAKALDDQSVKDILTKDAMSQFKQKGTVGTLFGEEVTNSDTANHGKMKGLYGFIPSANMATDNWAKSAIRGLVFNLMDRGAFPNATDANSNWCVANSAFKEAFMALDDSSTGISQKKTDAGFNDILLGGVNFSLIVDQAMTRMFPSAKPTCFLVTAKDGDKKLVKYARIKSARANSKEKNVLETAVRTTLQIAQFATLEVCDTEKHGLYVAGNTI